MYLIKIQIFQGDSISEYIQLVIKTTDPLVLRHAIISYNQQQDSTNTLNSMKNYWTKEWNLNTLITTPQQLQQIQINLNKLNSINDIDCVIITLAKAKRLQAVHVSNYYNLEIGVFLFCFRNTTWHSSSCKA